MASVLIAYGVVLTGLGLILQNLAPTLVRVAFIAAVAGGGLSLVWGVAALAGFKGRTWATFSVAVAAIVLLSQTIHFWMPASEDAASNLAVRALVTVMFLTTIGIVMYLLHGERPPEFYQPGKDAHSNPSAGQSEGQSRNRRSRR